MWMLYKGIVLHKFLQQGHTIHKEYYRQVEGHLRDTHFVGEKTAMHLLTIQYLILISGQK